jgi:hypothetical protein
MDRGIPLAELLACRLPERDLRSRLSIRETTRQSDQTCFRRFLTGRQKVYLSLRVVRPSRPEELHLQPLTGRVENWRAGLGRCLCSQFLALSYASATISLPCHVSNSRHVKRSVRFSRTALSFCLHSKGYDAYRLAALSSLCGLTL